MESDIIGTIDPIGDIGDKLKLCNLDLKGTLQIRIYSDTMRPYQSIWA